MKIREPPQGQGGFEEKRTESRIEELRKRGATMPVLAKVPGAAAEATASASGSSGVKLEQKDRSTSSSEESMSDSPRVPAGSFALLPLGKFVKTKDEEQDSNLADERKKSKKAKKDRRKQRKEKRERKKEHKRRRKLDPEKAAEEEHERKLDRAKAAKAEEEEEAKLQNWKKKLWNCWRSCGKRPKPRKICSSTRSRRASRC